MTREVEMETRKRTVYDVTLHGVWGPRLRGARRFRSWPEVARRLGLTPTPKPDFPLMVTVAGGHVTVEQVVQ